MIGGGGRDLRDILSELEKDTLQNVNKHSNERMFYKMQHRQYFVTTKNASQP